jgi:hypothetical protein
VPVLIEALPALPPDVRCEMARHLLHRWAPDRDADLRAWNWSAARARALVREQASQLREMAGTDEKCRQE